MGRGVQLGLLYLSFRVEGSVCILDFLEVGESRFLHQTNVRMLLLVVQLYFEWKQKEVPQTLNKKILF